MTRTRRFPLKGCRYLVCRYVKTPIDSDLDYWWFTCTRGDDCPHHRREGGTTKTCLSDPYTVVIDERRERDDGGVRDPLGTSSD